MDPRVLRSASLQVESTHVTVVLLCSYAWAVHLPINPGKASCVAWLKLVLVPSIPSGHADAENIGYRAVAADGGLHSHCS